MHAGDAVKQLHGRVAVVTGAGSGIGRATSIALARQGCRVAVVDINRSAAEDTARLVRAHGGGVSVHIVDVRDAEAVTALAADVAAEHGSCHILVNNAGVTSAGRFEQETMDDLRWIVDTNVWGVVHGTRSFLPMLLAADEAHLVNLSSMVGLLGLPHNTSYALTKGAVRSFTEALRSELIASNVGVTAVFPGSIRTNITQTARGSHAGLLARMASHRLSGLALRSPDRVAERIVRAIVTNRARVVIGADARALDVAARLFPGRSGWVGRLTSRLVR